MSSPFRVNNMPMQLAATPQIDTVLVKVQNVHDYALHHGKAQGWDDLCNFTCVRPPFEKLLFSFDSYGRKNPAKILHLDIAMRAVKPEDVYEFFDKNSKEVGAGPAFVRRVNPWRVLGMQFFMDAKDMGLSVFVCINESGKILADAENTAYILFKGPRWDQDGDDRILEALAIEGMSTVLASVSFMNCKNVEIIDNVPSRQVRRHCERTGKKVPVTYKTLVIHPIGKRRAIWPGTPSGLAMSLHICRGHFKDYRQGAGLGKWHRRGVWWWSPQVRGREEVGRVVKDYAVEANEA
jgi:hypothetical protein